MLLEPVHIISSVGDPNSAATWSGTPKALVDHFRERLPLLKVHDFTSTSKLQKVFQVLNLISGLGYRQASRVGLWQALHSRSVSKRIASMGAGTFLHIGSDHLPVINPRPDQRHYYFTDNTLARIIGDSPFGSSLTSRYKQVSLQREASLMQQMNGIFVTAQYVQAHVTETYGLPEQKVLAVGTGVGRVKDSKEIVKEYNNKLLFVAKQKFVGKGGYLLLDAFDLALKSRPDLRLVLIGNKDDPQASAAMSRMTQHPSIDFYNWDTPDYQTLVRSASLYVGPAPHEPWGIIYLESLLCQTPILGLNCNAFPEFASGGKFGFIVTDPNPKQIAETIVEAMASPAKLAMMGTAGRAHVIETYTWQKAVDRMIDMMSR